MNKEKKKSSMLIILLRIIFICIILGCLYYIFIWYKQNQTTQTIMSTIINNKIISSPNETISIDGINIDKLDINFDYLKNKNQNTMGWIKINSTNIDYPIVKTTNNGFYLNHSFDNSYNTAGWIFADYRNKNDFTDKNTIIYGHNRKDNSMFGSLKSILKKDWYSNKENQYFCVYTPEKNLVYRVFSIYKIKAETYYTSTSFASSARYGEFIKTIQKRSIYNFNTEVTNADTILTLSSCADLNANRVVLHAKLCNY